jgi:hypothetical protein
VEMNLGMTCRKEKDVNKNTFKCDIVKYIKALKGIYPI